jgi:hypothetical protein
MSDREEIPDFDRFIAGGGDATASIAPPSFGLGADFKAPPRDFRPDEVRVEDGTGNVSCIFRRQAAEESAALGLAYEYYPMTPMQSSSGHYSGGNYVEHDGRLSPADLEELRSVLDVAAADTAAVAEQRTMGTWFIRKASGGRPLLLRMGSEPTVKLAALVSRFKSA